MEKKELVPVDRHRYIVLAIYDIVDNKRRNKMVKYLEQYATRVQKSCFEGFLTLKQYKKMEREASQIIDEEADSLRIYILQDHAQVLSWGRGEVKNDNVIIY
ncbi:MAG: CRISPR-associated endonuclease Cas2 [Veillonellaceae bacterium]|nr:CRISPR-associated endonuclease Cas2 [Veillonellaceae bacterium]MDD6923733.1 CRISPR-associated endonuclease Cas2 [Veillonellaceae bacterium]